MKKMVAQRVVTVVCLFVVCLFIGAVLGLDAGTTSAQSASEIVLYAAEAPVKSGWNVVVDSTAAGGARLANSNLGGAKLSDPIASPSNYFEMTFNAQAGTGYRL